MNVLEKLGIRRTRRSIHTMSQINQKEPEETDRSEKRKIQLKMTYEQENVPDRQKRMKNKNYTPK